MTSRARRTASFIKATMPTSLPRISDTTRTDSTMARVVPLRDRPGTNIGYQATDNAPIALGQQHAVVALGFHRCEGFRVFFSNAIAADRLLLFSASSSSDSIATMAWRSSLAAMRKVRSLIRRFLFPRFRLRRAPR